jgi:hypothetical protein
VAAERLQHHMLHSVRSLVLFGLVMCVGDHRAAPAWNSVRSARRCASTQRRYPLPYKGIRSERDSNPRYQFPGIPHFQVSGPGCTAGRTRAPRIQISVVEGTTRQAKAPPLGLRWAWICGLSGRRWSATATSGDKTLVCSSVQSAHMTSSLGTDPAHIPNPWTWIDRCSRAGSRWRRT